MRRLATIFLALLLAPLVATVALSDGFNYIGQGGGGGGGVADDLTTTELDDTLVLSPDGAGGVEWDAAAATYDGGAVTNPFLAPVGCATPGYAFTGNADDGLCLGAETGWGVDTVAMALAGNEIAQIYSASGGEYFFEVKNPLTTPQRMFRVRGDTDLTRIDFFAPGESAFTYDIIMQGVGTLHTFNIYPLPDNVTPVTFTMLGGTGGPPKLRLGEDLDNGSNYVELSAPDALSANQTITFPDASGTVALAGTKVSQALDLVTSAVSSGTGVATDLLFAPANSTRYRMNGTFLVASTTASYGLTFIVAWPTSDALAGQCTFRGPTDSNSHTWQIIGTGSTGSGLKATWPSTPAVADIPTFLIYMDCVFSTTTNTSGNFALNFAGENVSGTYTLFAGSYFEWSVF